MSDSAGAPRGPRRAVRALRAAALPLAAGLVLAYAPGAAADAYASAPPVGQAAATALRPACDKKALENEGYRQGRTEGLADGRADGTADTYRKSYDDSFEPKPGLSEECGVLQAKAYKKGYKSGYEAGFKETAKKGKRKGDSARNVTVDELTVAAVEASCETDLIQFRATFTATGKGTLHYHWAGGTQVYPQRSLEFTGPGPQVQSDSIAVHFPPGGAVAAITEKVVIDSGPSKGKSAEWTITAGCPK
ncbi:hypothetical protein AB0F11_12545 [Streptomyces sp. NPDC032472]|uniref:hypothetical protein n=1 Tax=Streptomyces sp. NPDC032472 TaxID=3155018 RepID=UPI0033F9D48C